MIIGYFYLVSLLFFTIYSYSQIDLNLTLSTNTLYQSFQRQLINLGYYNRPLSAVIFIILIFLLFTFYFLLLYLIKQKKISFQQMIWLVVISSGILLFSYPSFSHDLFNYIFDARIVTKYSLNSYLFKALDFPNDPWIRFMHWTHRNYPYGPLWILLTIPFSFIGFGKLVLTLMSFKFMFTLFHLGNIYLIYKIMNKLNFKDTQYSVAFYAFNPLIIIESLISPHNEVMMLFFLLLSIYIDIIKRKTILGIVSLLISAGIKFITIILLPIFFLPKIFPILKKPKLLISVIFFLLFIPIIPEIIYREPYPWYFILLIGIASLFGNNGKIKVFVAGISVGALLRYFPYLYYGDYSTIVTSQQTWLFIIPIVCSLIYLIFNLTRSKNRVL